MAPRLVIILFSNLDILLKALRSTTTANPNIRLGHNANIVWKMVILSNDNF
jgi:hypothetical protein